MIRIAVHLGKGGAGKSTTCWALSSFLCRQARVLAVDLDPQATLTSALIDDTTVGAYDVLTKRTTVAESAVWATDEYGDNLRVLAGGQALGNLEQETVGDLDRYYGLRDALDALGSDADITVIDTPPGSSSLLTVMALVAATHVVTPVSLDPAAFEQLPSIERLIAQVRRRLNPDLKWIGILPMRFDGRRRLDNEVLVALRSYNVFMHPPVPESVRVKEVMGRGETALTVGSLFELTVTSIMQAVYA